jgi:4-amino-4-deoxy-L-arabinose transferase-like glycosyltransferase
MGELDGPEPNPGLSPGQVQERKPESKPDSRQDRKFWVALGAFGVLAAVIWFTLGEGTVFAFGRPVEIKLIPLFVIGMFVLRTLVAREADKIRRRSGDEAGKL